MEFVLWHCSVPFKWQLKWLGKSFQQMQKLFPLGKMNFKKDYLKVHTDWRLAAGTIHHFISTPLLNANYPLCENSRDSLKWISQSTKKLWIEHIQDPPDTVFRENVQGGVPGVPDHPTSVLTPGVGVLLAELGLVVPSATCQLPESGATLIMCLSLDKCLAYRIFKNSSLCL